MKIRVNDTEIFFDVEGLKLVPDGAQMRERPTLVLLHGGPGFDHSAFKPEFGTLCDVAQVVYMDLRGNGRSDWSAPGCWNLAQWADDIVAFCAALQIERPVVLGLSFGGLVAQTYAIRHPDHPAKLILMSTSAGGDTGSEDAEPQSDIAVQLREAARSFFCDPGPEGFEYFLEFCMRISTRAPQQSDRITRAVKNAACFLHVNGRQSASAAPNLLPELKRVQCPTLILAGADDPFAPPSASEAIAAALPEGLARLEVIPNCGHGTFRDAPRITFDLIRHFLAS